MNWFLYDKDLRYQRVNGEWVLPQRKNNKNTRKMCEICSKLTIKTPKRRQPMLLNLNMFLTFFYCAVNDS